MQYGTERLATIRKSVGLKGLKRTLTTSALCDVSVSPLVLVRLPDHVA